MGAHLSGRALWLSAVLGTLIGAGSYTFRYGEGLSYFSTDPAACKNCHIMNEEYNSWTKGPHHGGATCIDCHLPHAFSRSISPKQIMDSGIPRASRCKTSTSPS